MDNQVAIKVLQAARNRLEKGWTQRTPARNIYGVAVNAYDADAVSFCLLGSLVPSSIEVQGKEGHMANVDDWYDILLSLKVTISPENPSLSNIALFNDSPNCTKEKVLDVIDRTIFRLQNEMTPSQGVVLAMAGGNSLGRFGSNDPC